MSYYVEPRLRRDFGGIITAYFKFLKVNMAGIFRSFIAYNGIFVILFIITSYMMVIGFTEVFANGVVDGYAQNPDEVATMIAGFGIILFIIIFLIATLINYGLSSSYVSIYEIEKRNNLPRKQVWSKTTSKLGGLFLMALVAVVLYVIYFIIQLMLAFIPILGSIVTLVIGFAFNAWISMAVFSYVHNNHLNIFQALEETMTLLFSNIWRAIGVNFVLGLLIQLGLYALSIVPAIVSGVVIFHTVQENGGIVGDVTSQILLVILLTLLCVLAMFSQALSQTVNAFLYFNLHESKYNTYLHTRISKLGETAV
ncbi:MAG: hypothetical protein WBA16_04560 [Nonlabens sp.]